MHYVEDADAHKSHLQRILDDIAGRGIVDVIFGGDIGTFAAVPAFFEAMWDHNFTPEVVLGNHDAYANVRPWWGTGPVEGKLCSSTSEGPWRRIILDSSDNIIGERQLAWLARESESARRAAIFVHHPVLEMNTPIDRSRAALRDRADLKAFLNGLDCEVALFCGHYHMTDELREANIRLSQGARGWPDRLCRRHHRRRRQHRRNVLAHAGKSGAMVPSYGIASSYCIFGSRG